MSVPFPELAAIRLGFGLSPAIAPPADATAVLADAQAAATRPSVYTTREAQELHREFNRRDRARGEARKASADNKVPEEVDRHYRTYRKELALFRDHYLLTRVGQCAAAPVGFGDRLVQFWADHFTVRAKGHGLRPMTMAFIEEAIRPQIFGSFATLLHAAETHPSMVTFLDQNRSIGPGSPAARRARSASGLNENLAREILELHTLGVSAGYTQEDVRNLAELLTGLSYDMASGQRFFGGRAEPGAETVLGSSYGGGKASEADIAAVLDDLAVRPETARHLARKLAMHFVSDAPEDELVEALSATWLDSGGSLPRVYEVLIGHPALGRQFRQKARQPFDFLAAAVRALAIPPEQVTALDDRGMRRLFLFPIRDMGQPWFDASGPDGWKEEAEAWIRPQLLAARIDWAMNAPQKLVDPLPDPRSFMETTLGSTAGEALAWAVPKAESIREGVGLVLASAEFNRR